MADFFKQWLKWKLVTFSTPIKITIEFLGQTGQKSDIASLCRIWRSLWTYSDILLLFSQKENSTEHFTGDIHFIFVYGFFLLTNLTFYLGLLFFWKFYFKISLQGGEVRPWSRQLWLQSHWPQRNSTKSKIKIWKWYF